MPPTPQTVPSSARLARKHDDIYTSETDKGKANQGESVELKEL